MYIHFFVDYVLQMDTMTANKMKYRFLSHKKFLHQFVSSQLDVDRLDYLRRDSFYTGVSEGVVSSDRIIKMLNVVNDQLVVDAKGTHSIEKFLIARWLMYWQVYLHKTVVSVEQLLIKIMTRVKFLISKEEYVYLNKNQSLLLNNPTLHNIKNKDLLNAFSSIDDIDIFSSLKEWVHSSDTILSVLANKLLYRRLFKIEIQDSPFDQSKIDKLKNEVYKKMNISKDDIDYFVFTSNISKNAYSAFDDKIQILYKNGELVDITEASDMLNMSILSKTVRKYFLCYPKEIRF